MTSNVVSGPQLRRAEYYTLAAILCFVLATAIATTVAGGRDVFALLRSLHPVPLALALALAAANYALRTLRWNLFSRAQGLALPVFDNSLVYIAGLGLSATPGKVGEAFRLWLLNRLWGVGYDRSLPLLIADRLIDALSVAILCLVGATAFPDYVFPALFLVLTMLALTAVTSSRRAGRLFLRSIYAAVRRRPRWFAKAGLVVRRMERLTHSPALITGLALGLLGWGAEAVGLHFVLLSLGADVNPLASVFIFAFSTLVGALILVPGGLGGTEATMVGLLAASGVSVDIALLATFLFRLATLWFGILLGYSSIPFALRLKPSAT